MRGERQAGTMGSGYPAVLSQARESVHAHTHLSLSLPSQSLYPVSEETERAPILRTSEKAVSARTADAETCG